MDPKAEDLQTYLKQQGIAPLDRNRSFRPSEMIRGVYVGNSGDSVNYAHLHSIGIRLMVCCSVELARNIVGGVVDIDDTPRFRILKAPLRKGASIKPEILETGCRTIQEFEQFAVEFLLPGGSRTSTESSDDNIASFLWMTIPVTDVASTDLSVHFEGLANVVSALRRIRVGIPCSQAEGTAGEESGSGEDVASARGNDGDTLPGILVHCVAGRSRSVTLTAAALMVVLRDWYCRLMDATKGDIPRDLSSAQRSSQAAETASVRPTGISTAEVLRQKRLLAEAAKQRRVPTLTSCVVSYMQERRLACYPNPGFYSQLEMWEAKVLDASTPV